MVYRVLVQIMLYKCFIFSAGYNRCYVHVGYMVLCTYCTVCMMDMHCCVRMVLCACWICGAMYR